MILHNTYTRLLFLLFMCTPIVIILLLSSCSTFLRSLSPLCSGMHLMYILRVIFTPSQYIVFVYRTSYVVGTSRFIVTRFAILFYEVRFGRRSTVIRLHHAGDPFVVEVHLQRQSRDPATAPPSTS